MIKRPWHALKRVSWEFYEQEDWAVKDIIRLGDRAQKLIVGRGCPTSGAIQLNLLQHEIRSKSAVPSMSFPLKRARTPAHQRKQQACAEGRAYTAYLMLHEAYSADVQEKQQELERERAVRTMCSADRLPVDARSLVSAFAHFRGFVIS